MPIIRASQAATHELPHARFTSLATPSRGASETSVWRVRLAPGAEPNLHTVTREEIFVILAGRARVVIGEERADACAGDAIVVPANTPFSLANAGDEEVEALCCLPVGGMAQLPGGEAFTPPWAR